MLGSQGLKSIKRLLRLVASCVIGSVERPVQGKAAAESLDESGGARSRLLPIPFRDLGFRIHHPLTRCLLGESERVPAQAGSVSTSECRRLGSRAASPDR